MRTRAQLIDEGVKASTIDYRCRSGAYTRLFSGIYCIGEPSALARCAAIVEWLPDAALSHRTAGWLRNMQPEPTLLEATSPTYRRAPKWLKLYRRELDPRSISESWGMPTVDPAHTLFDCVAVMNPDDAGRLIDEHVGRTVESEELLRICESGKHGAIATRRQLRDAALHAASEPERRFARALAKRNCRMLANHPVGPYVCDFVHERSRTIVEIDGRQFHSEPAVFRSDRRRQNWLVLDRWLLLRYAAADVFADIDSCADEVAAVVRAR